MRRWYRLSAGYYPVMEGNSPLVRLRGVHKYFGDNHVLRGIDLDVDRGEVVMVVGPSGSGKSTMLRCINRLEHVNEGTIEIDGVPMPEDAKGLNKLRSDIGMVLQSFNLFPHMTALQNIALGPTHALGVPKKEAQQRARELLERVEITEKDDV